MADLFFVIVIVAIAGFLVWRFAIKNVDEATEEFTLPPNDDFPLAVDYDPETEVDEDPEADLKDKKPKKDKKDKPEKSDG